MDFGLFYFANAGADHRKAYELLLAGATFADANGFSAVWTPERHFHEFGGIYPNPAVTGAAIAAVTERVSIRAGSIVAPLHNPIRVAEEWSVVDNLSGGRAGIAFASGWHAGDFVFNPGRYHERRSDTYVAIDQVRRLWHGETVSAPDGLDNSIDVRIFPRPVQSDLPTWLTTSGDVASFEAAGRMGVGVLTHLLGQEISAVRAKIDAYRAAWLGSGHAGRGHVVLMIHTYIGSDRATVKEIVRAPFGDYLLSSFGLLVRAVERLGVAGMAQDMESLTEADRRYLINASFDRYFLTNGLFGDVDDGIRICGELQAAGVDEVACLIDFGVGNDLVLDGLNRLSSLRAEWLSSIGPDTTVL